MSLTGPRTVVVVNPTAGGRRAGQVWAQLRRLAPELANATKIQADDATTGRAELDGRLQEGVERVLAVGGDGTAHLVVNALLTAGLGERVAFGLVPAGTGSDLARSLDLAARPAAALQRVITAQPRPIDALCIDTAAGERRYGINIASAGLSGAVVPAVNANPRKGHLTYLTTTLRALLGYRPIAC
ncbi:MAG: diacylglycerol kinase family protein, partial [Acidobacteriota bacterium]